MPNPITGKEQRLVNTLFTPLIMDLSFKPLICHPAVPFGKKGGEEPVSILSWETLMVGGRNKKEP